MYKKHQPEHSVLRYLLDKGCRDAALPLTYDCGFFLGSKASGLGLPGPSYKQFRVVVGVAPFL